MGEQPSGGRVGRLVRGLAVALGSLAVALVLAELGLRLFAPQGLVTENFRYEALPGGDEGGPGYRLQPGLFLPGRVGGRVNSLGLRGAEPPAAGAAERLVVVGDSFVYGAGVAEGDTFVEALGAAAGEQVVINAGTPGYGTARELAWLETFGDELAPDLVLLCVFVGNDLTDNLDPSAPRIVDGRLFFDGAEVEEGVAGDRTRIWRNSLHLWRLWDRSRQGTVAPPAAAEGAGPAVDDGARAAAIERMHDAFASEEAARLEVYLPVGGPDSAELRRMDTAYDLTRLALEGVAAWCAERDAELGVVLIPDVVQVDERLRARVLGGVGLAEDDLDWQRPQRTVAGWCAELGLPVLDLLPSMAEQQAVLRAGGDPTDMGLYLFGDSHWSAPGHAFAAAKLQEAWGAAPGPTSGATWGAAWAALLGPR